MNSSSSAVRRYPHSFSIEQILAKPQVQVPSAGSFQVISSGTPQGQDDGGRGNICDVSRASSPATSSCQEDTLDDGKSDIELTSDDGNGAYD